MSRGKQHKFVGTLELLKEYLHYSPRTGVWTRVRSFGGQPAGSEVGRITSGGYRNFQFMGYRTHDARWAVFYMTGKWPDVEVDHANLDKLDCRWVNIRPAAYPQNRANVRVRASSRSGVKGVRQLPYGHWTATIGSKPRVYLGVFDTKEAASDAYMRAARERYGAFARRN
jgi:hypothetical protein